ncbi:MAG TPA: thiamine pyrophosphate-dependent enzyme [Chitinophagaceae bacterium]|nr:thiamine pyrophosphate-dependent enzyme [Chitinophagaceae bacterium]
MIEKEILLKAFRLMCYAKSMAETYDANRQICKYVHSTSRGHEAIQLATAFHLENCDHVSPYYRDESMLLGLGYSPYELMLQLLTKADDPFTGGRSYYAHPNSKARDKPKIIHQSSATGMQAIPTTGVAQGIQYLEKISSPLLLKTDEGELPIVVCSLGDGSVTEGEVSEALQFAVLKQLPIIYLVQDNDWGISATAEETRAMNAYEYADGFKGLSKIQIDGTDFTHCYKIIGNVINEVRTGRKPWLVHAKVPLLNHHTSGVRKDFYRTEQDLAKHAIDDPFPKLKKLLHENGMSDEELEQMEREAAELIGEEFMRALNSPDPDIAKATEHIFVATTVNEEKGERCPVGEEKIMMVDAALFAIRELMEDHPECIFFGQDVGRRLGGVFREAATLAGQFGDHRVFNTAIQEAYIIGSTVGLNAVGVKPIVEIQFADYIYPGFNQLVSEISKSCYLSCGKYPVSTIIRVPVGAYGGGGPYHSGCVETTLLSIKGVKIAYPSNAADMKGMMKAAFYDGNPVIMLEHKGLYWSKVPGTEDAKSIEPSRDYILPLGKANAILNADDTKIKNGESCCIVTYGMGVYWAKAAAKKFPGQIEILDLRTLFPLDEEMIFASVKRHGKCLVLTEEQQNNSFAEALAGRIFKECFKWLDGPVEVLGAANIPAIPLNMNLENAVLPNAEKVSEKIKNLLAY